MASSVIGIIGWSGSGKTTLLEKLLPLLIARGLRVNVIKHGHHEAMLEPPHKDTARFRAAGAAEVVFASSTRFAIMHELRDEPEPTLEMLVARLAPADVTLVEGFRSADIPRLEVYRPGVGKPPRHQDEPNIIAVASDQPPPPGWDGSRTWLDLNDTEAVLVWLLRTAGLQA
ncbi:MAG: molybdopterin-guanine dinucleotide biosynthesis protein B [Oxalobacter sp.]|nr:MAG: molybdopterin-guanine dinucleotide biosynthesis protein B [Oxalobacter sp.]